MIKELTEFLRQRKKMNLLIVAVNVAIFLLLELSGGDTMDVMFMESHGAMYPPAALEGGEYYRLFTCMFLHFGLEHLIYNMLLLIFAGDMLESAVGAVRYLILYLGGGLAGNLLSLAVQARTENFAVSAGASGAIFAVIGALVWIVVKKRGKAENINGKGLMAMAFLSLIQGFTSAGVDNFAHLGGFMGGFLLAALLEIPYSLIRRIRG